MARPKLKKCLNPECDFYYFGYGTDRYCSKKCRQRNHNIKTREYRNEWNRRKRDRLKLKGG